MNRNDIGRMPVTRHRFPRAYLLALLATLLVTLVVSGCSGATYAQTAVPTTSAAAATSSPSATAVACDPGTTATQSYAPLASLAAAAGAGGTLAEIRARGTLRVGVSADTLLLGARNPLTGQIEGFDIDMARELAKAILGDRDKVTLVVITAAQRKDVLVNKTVDVVARNMTMTCDRWQNWPIAFSAEYYHAGQKVLVRKGLAAKTLDEVAAAKLRVCAPTGTTSLTKLKEYESKGAQIVTSDTHTGCLALFQQGKVDAITGDDTVLAGLAAQDPYAVVPAEQQAITAEPYGLGFNAADKTIVEFTNRLLEDMKADGRWKAIYDTWLAAPLGPAPTPPVAAYGRA